MAVKSITLYGQPVEIRCQTLGSSRAENLVYAFIASPCPEFSCGMVWGDKGMYGVFLSPQDEASSSPPPFIQQRWPHVRPSAVLNQAHNTAPVNEALPAQAQGSLVLSGTVFQQQVWRALLDIPVGESRTYADIARAIGRPRAWRAVANAVAANPILYLVPCHRVVPRQGGVGNYRYGAELKRRLLAQEGIYFSDEGAP
ncbi:MAG: MGMT family protein [Desulfuromonadaceae bacterium]